MRAFHLCSGRLPWQIEFGRLIRPTCIFVGSLWLASLTLCAWQGIRRWQSFDQHLRRLNDKVWSCVKVVGSRRFNRWSTRFKTDMRKLAQLRSCAAWPLSSSQYRPSPLCWGHPQQSQRTRTAELSRAEQLRDVLVSFGSWMLSGCSCFAVERETLSFLFGRSSALVLEKKLFHLSVQRILWILCCESCSGWLAAEYWQLWSSWTLCSSMRVLCLGSLCQGLTGLTGLTVTLCMVHISHVLHKFFTSSSGWTSRTSQWVMQICST